MTGVRLGFDTATDRLSVAATRAPSDRVVQFTVAGARRHAAELLPLVDRALQELRAHREEIEVIALSDGPGSFTGLRVGAATAKALVACGGARLLTASTLLVRAAGVARPGQRALAVSSALRGELFAGLWMFEPDRVIELIAPRPASVDQIAAYPDADLLVGEGPAPLLAALEQRRSMLLTGPAWPSAASLLRLVEIPGACHPVPDVPAWEPDYGRPAEAQARWEKSHGRPFPDPAGDGR